MPMQRIYPGMMFGRLTVITKWGSSRFKSITWLCRCACGEYTIVLSSLLRRGTTNSCGCLQRELSVSRNKTHGMSKSRIYLVWNSMIQRCTNESSINYNRYGAKGLDVCNEWKESFLNFYNWAVLNGYKQGLQIDRINNTLNYSPDNCRFVTAEINGNNTKNSRHWIVNGKEFVSGTQAGLYFGVCRKTIRNWCLGDKQRNIHPHHNCSAPKKYQEVNQC